jgi:hypothetical protein
MGMVRKAVGKGAPRSSQAVRYLVANDANVCADLLQQGGARALAHSRHDGVQQGRVRAVERGGAAGGA